MPCSVPEREALATKERWHAGVVQRRTLVARTDKCQARPIARHVSGRNKILSPAQLAIENKVLEKLPLAQRLNAITTSRLIPMLEPEQ
jgi:hypothetical protein